MKPPTNTNQPPTLPPLSGGCTKTELGLAYFPLSEPQNAWRILRRWIQQTPGLADELRTAGYTPRQRSLTPRQVRLIVEALGEPL